MGFENWKLEEAIAYYGRQGAPKDQTALVSLLKEVQAESGGRLPHYVLGVIGEAYGVKESFLLAIIRRIPSLRLGDTHRLELCAGANCGKHTELAKVAESLKNVTLKFVPCMHLCGKCPNIRWDGKVYSGVTEAFLRELTEGK